VEAGDRRRRDLPHDLAGERRERAMERDLAVERAVDRQGCDVGREPGARLGERPGVGGDLEPDLGAIGGARLADRHPAGDGQRALAGGRFGPASPGSAGAAVTCALPPPVPCTGSSKVKRYAKSPTTRPARAVNGTPCSASSGDASEPSTCTLRSAE